MNVSLLLLSLNVSPSGAKEAHAVSPHFAQIMYFGLFSVLAMAPTYCSFSQTAELFQSIWKNKSVGFFRISLALVAGFISIHFFRLGLFILLGQFLLRLFRNNSSTLLLLAFSNPAGLIKQYLSVYFYVYKKLVHFLPYQELSCYVSLPSVRFMLLFHM